MLRISSKSWNVDQREDNLEDLYASNTGGEIKPKKPKKHPQLRLSWLIEAALNLHWSVTILSSALEHRIKPLHERIS